MLLCILFAITHRGLLFDSVSSILGLPTKLIESIDGTKPGQTKRCLVLHTPSLFYIWLKILGVILSNDFITWGLLVLGTIAFCFIGFPWIIYMIVDSCFFSFSCLLLLSQ
ncbi:hypothetical protein EV426DRAFT_123351 [Tirmania nivea]|nr:hypothetical protein EV426DRAFT_123351 [Tirmania nivea]